MGDPDAQYELGCRLRVENDYVQSDQVAFYYLEKAVDQASYTINVTSHGFSLPIIHRDSPLSPFYRPNATFSERWESDRRRSAALYDYSLAATLDGVLTPVFADAGSYLTRLAIGTPPYRLYLNIDTGSSLIWTQCLPCKQCYPQSYPPFDTTKSSTYSVFDCVSVGCNDLSSSSCSADKKCLYSIYYADDSSSNGNLSADTFTVGSDNGADISLNDVAFGCGDNNRGVFTRNEAGVLGLGGGPLSFVSQLDPGQFSYCLGPYGVQGKLAFGRSAVMAGGYTTLELVERARGRVFYYLNLTDISVGSERLNVPPGTFDRSADDRGGIVIDSGATYTRLFPAAYDLLATKLIEKITLKPKSGSRDVAPLCYWGSKDDLKAGKIPNLTFHFALLDVVLPPENFFFSLKDKPVLCFTMGSITGVSIFGNMAQQNKNVGYDWTNRRLYIQDVPSCA